MLHHGIETRFKMATENHCKRPFRHISSKYNLVKVSTVYPTCYTVSTTIFLKIYGQKVRVIVGKPSNNHYESKPGKVRLFSLESSSGLVLPQIPMAKAIQAGYSGYTTTT